MDLIEGGPRFGSVVLQRLVKSLKYISVQRNIFCERKCPFPRRNFIEQISWSVMDIVVIICKTTSCQSSAQSLIDGTLYHVEVER